MVSHLNVVSRIESKHMPFEIKFKLLNTFYDVANKPRKYSCFFFPSFFMCALSFIFINLLFHKQVKGSKQGYLYTVTKYKMRIRTLAVILVSDYLL